MQSIRLNVLVNMRYIIPEHPDITGEVDKLLEKIYEAEDKLAVMVRSLHYGDNVAEKTVL